jgi:DNA-binding NarL/FixJ family response regulator
MTLEKAIAMPILSSRTPSLHHKSVSSTHAVRRFSPRRAQVLDALARGETTREIATELHISVKTVEQRYREVRETIGLRNLREVIIFAVWRVLSRP